MGVPNHGPDCWTTTFPTACRYCGRRVYVLTCTCGSCVLFDKLGEAWPLHAESSPSTAMQDLIEEGWTPADIQDLIRREARARGVTLPEERGRGATGTANRPPRNEPVEVAPDGQADVCGQVVSVRACPDMLVRLSIAHTTMARALMGQLADRSYTEVLLETDERDTAGRTMRFRFFVEQSRLAPGSVRAGRSVSASLSARDLPTEGAIWLASEIKSD